MKAKLKLVVVTAIVAGALLILGAAAAALGTGLASTDQASRTGGKHEH